MFVAVSGSAERGGDPLFSFGSLRRDLRVVSWNTYASFFRIGERKLINCFRMLIYQQATNWQTQLTQLLRVRREHGINIRKKDMPKPELFNFSCRIK